MIREKTCASPTIIDLTGPAGNAFALMGTASSLAKQLGLDVENVISQMKSGDYENLIQVFDSYFGDFIILER